MSRKVEAGLRNYDLWFVREADLANPGDTPEYEKYSSVVSNFSWSAEAGNDPRRGLGDADPHEFVKSSETHEVTVEYDLNKWFTDGSGNAYDASYDGIMRDSDNMLPNSHTLVAREDKGAVSAENTVNGTNSKATRIYSVGLGGLIGEVTLSGDSSDGGPVTVELSYNVQKGRSFQIDQPDGSDTLDVVSTSDSDTFDIQIAGDDFSNDTESITLSGTTATTGATSFSDIAYIWCSEEPVGDITISESTSGDELAVIHGSETYDNTEGDRGIPVPDSREDSVTESAESFLASTFERDSSSFPHEIVSASLTVSNNIEETEVQDILGMGLHAGNRDLEEEISMYSENASHAMLVESMTNNAADQDWIFNSGTLTLVGAILNEPGERAAEAGQAVMTVDNLFNASGINIS